MDTFWKAVKKVKFNATLNKACGKDGLYSDKLILVKRVEKELQMNSSEVSFENMTAKNLKTAAEFFIYLNTCPHTSTLKSLFILWADFYADLFGKQSRDQIILNRAAHRFENCSSQITLQITF